MKPRTLALVGLLFFGLIAVLYNGFGRNPREVPFGLRGKPAPSFIVRRLDNLQPLRADELKGRPLVINFWATWCGPCKTEHPVLEWGHREYGHEVTFLGVVFEDREDHVKRYLLEHGSAYLQAFDPKSRMSVDYGVAGVPETYFIRADGTIQDKHVGAIDPESMLRQLKRLVAEAPAPSAEAGK